MAARTRSGAQLAVAAAGIAATPATIEERAGALLELLRRAVPYEAAWLALRDPERRIHTPLATAGHAEPLRAYFRTPAGEAEVELLGLNRRRPPMLVSEIPVPLEDLRAWADHLWPAGFRGGLAAGLFTADGRHLGFLSVLTDTAARPDESARDLIGTLTPLIAHAVDRMRTVAAVASIVRDAVAGTVLTRGTDALRLPGLPPHPLLAPRSPVLRFAAARLAAGDTHAVFLCPAPVGAGRDELVRVTVLGCARAPLDHLLAAVTVSPPGELRGLSRLQLQLLGLLVDGWADARIAAALGTTEQELADQLFAVLAALAAPHRSVAAVRAVREGIYLPVALSGPPE